MYVCVCMCCSLAFNLCRPVGVMRLLLLLCSFVVVVIVIVIVIIVFFFYYTLIVHFQIQFYFTSFSSPSFVFRASSCSLFFVFFWRTLATRCDFGQSHQYTHAHYKLFPSNARTNERATDRITSIEEKMSCTRNTSSLLPWQSQNIRHVSCCFVFWLKKKLL